MSALTIRTNNVPRDLLNYFELSTAQQAEVRDRYHGCVTSDEAELDEWLDGQRFFVYKNYAYCLADFLRIQQDGWDGGAHDTAFSGTLVKMVQNGERVVVAQYFS